MKCPQCGNGKIESVLTCAECGYEIDVGASLRVNTRVQSNLGTVIGAKIEQLNAPVISDNLYSTQVYAWHGDWTEKAWDDLLDKAARPYKYLKPYTARERALFAGRDGEARLLADRIVDQRLVLVHGEQGVGKTSLVNAGVIPNLMETGMMVLSLEDYNRPVESILVSLGEQQEELGLDLEGANTLSKLLIMISEQIEGALTLVLDHFERLYGAGFDQPGRETVLGELRKALDAVEPQYLRMVFVADRGIFQHIGELEAHLPNLSYDHFELEELPVERAREAILHPILKKPRQVLYETVPYNEEFLDRVLIGDLAALTDGQAVFEKIHPQHLGIVCSALYETAVRERAAYINREIYDLLEGAQGILVSHFGKQLEQDMRESYNRSRELLLRMAVPGMPDWVKVEELSRNGTAGDAHLLDELANAGYLARRSLNGHPEYAFPSDSAAAVVETLDAALMASRRRAHEVLELAWNVWVERREPATSGQLRYLADYGEHLEPRLDRALFILYSALVKGEPSAGPLAWLEAAPHSRELIEYFEEPERNALPEGISDSIETDARKMLGLQGLEPHPWGDDPKIPSGPLSWAAVKAADDHAGETATLALILGYGYAGWNRIDWALDQLDDARMKMRLRGARQGLLIEEISGYRENMKSPPAGDVRRIWWWRARRRMSRSGRDLGWMILGAALGAGLLTGLMRSLIAIPAVNDIAGISFAIQGYWNAILAAGAALGALLAKPLLLNGEASAGELPAALKPFARTESGERLLSIVLGTLGFTLFFLLAAVFNGVNFAQRPLLLLTAPLAGLGVALGLSGQPGAGRPQGAATWARHLFPGGLGFVLSQIAASIAELNANLDWLSMTLQKKLAQIVMLRAAGTIINKAPKYYRDEFSYLIPVQRLFESAGWVPFVLSLLDAAAVGALLTAGMILGMHAARRWRARWDLFVRHTEV